MLYYRLYFFDRYSGHIDHFREFEADGDVAAIAIAERWRDGRQMELWNLGRRLRRWDQAAHQLD
jgi:hypothetical protein